MAPVKTSESPMCTISMGVKSSLFSFSKFVVLCGFLLSTFLGQHVHAAHVVELDASTFNQVITATSDVWIVKFYAPWCGHCQKLAPKFEEAAAAVRAEGLTVRFAKVDVDESPSLKDVYGIEGFPTVLYFTPPEAGGGTRAPRTDVAPGMAREYNGPRTAEGLRDVAARLSRSPVVALPTSTSGFDAHVWAKENGRDGVFFVFVDSSNNKNAPQGGSDDPEDPAKLLRKAFRSVSRRLRDTLTFAQAVVEEDETDTSALGFTKYLYPSTRSASSSSSSAAAEVALGSSITYPTPPPTPYVARIEAGSEAVQFITGNDLLKNDIAYTFKTSGSNKKRAKAAAAAAGDSTSIVSPAQRASDSLHAWAQHWRWPRVIALGIDNYSQVASNAEGRYVVVAAVHAKDLPSPSDDAELKKVKSQTPSANVLSALRRLADPFNTLLSSQVSDKLLFAWLDASTFEAFLQQYKIDVADAPRLLVFDAPNKIFWVDEMVDEEDEMETWFTEIIAGRAPMQRTDLLAVPQRVYNALGFWGAALVGLLSVGTVLFMIYKLVIAEACGYNEDKRRSAATSSGDGTPTSAPTTPSRRSGSGSEKNNSTNSSNSNGNVSPPPSSGARQRK